MTQYYTFEDALPTIEQAGGKGLSLLHLAQQGLNVPPAAVLSTRFFAPWLGQLKASPEWRDVEEGAGEW